MVSSYINNADYGYDQVNVGSDEFNDILRTLDTNNIDNIGTIREREVRMFNKLNSYKPSGFAPYNYCSPNLFNATGVQKIQERSNMKQNIEDYYYASGNNMKDQLNYPLPNTQETLNYPQTFYQTQTPKVPIKPIPNKAMFKYFPTEHNFALEQKVKHTGKKSKQKSESFRNNSDSESSEDDNDIEYLQEEMEKMEQKNNLLVIFIFFLVIIVLVQYTKTKASDQKIVVLPMPEKSDASPDAIKDKET